ncbi:hypothetical protein Tco_1478318, partial [Tanacetum coccineum]
WCSLLKSGDIIFMGQKVLSTLTTRVSRQWIELLSDYECEIKYHPGKGNVVADALSRKERLKPRRVRAMSITIHSRLKTKILEAQSEASKDLKAPTESLHHFYMAHESLLLLGEIFHLSEYEDDMAVKDFKKFFKRRGRCGDPNHLIGECPKPLKDKNQRAFVGDSWSDSGEEDDEKAKDEACLMAYSSSEVHSDSSYFSYENSSIDNTI